MKPLPWSVRLDLMNDSTDFNTVSNNNKTVIHEEGLYVYYSMPVPAPVSKMRRAL